MDIKNINAKTNNIGNTIKIVKLIKQLKSLPLTADFKDTEQYRHLLQLITTLTNIYAIADKRQANAEQKVAAPMIVDTERFGLSIPIFTSFERCLLYSQQQAESEPTLFIKSPEMTNDQHKSIFTFAKDHGVDTLLINDGTESLPINLKEIIAILESSSQDNKYKDDYNQNKSHAYEMDTWFVDSIAFQFSPIKKIDFSMSLDLIMAGAFFFKKYFISMVMKDGKSIDIANENNFNAIQFLKTAKETEYAYIEILGIGDFFGGRVNYRIAGADDVDVIIINPNLSSVADDSDEFNTWKIKNFMNVVEYRANYTNATRIALNHFAEFKDQQHSTKIEHITVNSNYLNTLASLGVTDDVIAKLAGNDSWTTTQQSTEKDGSANPTDTVVPTAPTPVQPISPKTTIKCFACGEEWEFDDSKIPVGERYEVTCPKCQMKLRRKKV